VKGPAPRVVTWRALAPFVAIAVAAWGLALADTFNAAAALWSLAIALVVAPAMHLLVMKTQGERSITPLQAVASVVAGGVVAKIVERLGPSAVLVGMSVLLGIAIWVVFRVSNFNATLGPSGRMSKR
jgi:hypothetical protein